jgi:hypothetical protein
LRETPHAKGQRVILHPRNLRERPCLSISQKDITFDFDDAKRFGVLRRTRVVCSAAFEPAEIDEVGRVVLLVTIDEETGGREFD